MERYTKGSAILIFVLSLYAAPTIAGDAKHCIEWGSDSVTNTCWGKVTVTWCFGRHDDPSLRCRAANSKNKFTRGILLDARQVKAIEKPSESTSRPFGACEGIDSIVVTPEGDGHYNCKCGENICPPG